MRFPVLLPLALWLRSDSAWHDFRGGIRVGGLIETPTLLSVVYHAVAAEKPHHGVIFKTAAVAKPALVGGDERKLHAGGDKQRSLVGAM